MNGEPEAIVLETDAAPSPETPEAPAASTPMIRSGGQVLLNRYSDHFRRLMTLHQRLVQVRGAIVATPAPSSGAVKTESLPEKPTAFFTGLTMIADADELVISALERDIEDIAKLF